MNFYLLRSEETTIIKTKQNLRQQFGFIIEGVDNATHPRDYFNSVGVRLVLWFIIEDHEHAGPLIENSFQLLVEDHLREFPFHIVEGELDEVCNVRHFHTGERLDDSLQVLFEQVVVPVGWKLIIRSMLRCCLAKSKIP